MSRREAVVRGVAGALQPKGLDLAQLRQRSIRERAVKVRGEDAAGALAFQAMNQVDPEDYGRGVETITSYGDPLAAALLRLKYADQNDKRAFNTAHLILMRRHGGLSRMERSLTVHALAFVAIFEWVHDRCQKCRKDRRGVPQPHPCLACGLRREKGGILTGMPSAGCPKCGGSGRLFAKAKPGRGMQCVTCRSTGTITLPPKRRLELVNDFIVSAQKQAGQKPMGLTVENFRGHWMPRYYRFLEVLRATDKKVAAGLDLGFQSDQNARTGPAPLGNTDEDQAEAEPERAEELPPDWPRTTSGHAFPKIP